jgi:hypothetical protein
MKEHVSWLPQKGGWQQSACKRALRKPQARDDGRTVYSLVCHALKSTGATQQPCSGISGCSWQMCVWGRHHAGIPNLGKQRAQHDFHRDHGGGHTGNPCQMQPPTLPIFKYTRP